MNNEFGAYTVAIVDDHQLFRDAVAELLHSARDAEGNSLVRISISAENGQDFIQQLEVAGESDLVMLDINMPLMDGWETLRWIRHHGIHSKVLVLTMDSSTENMRDAIRLGAKGYFTKDEHRDKILNGVIQTLQYGFYYSETVVNALLEGDGPNRADQPNVKLGGVELTPRELEFLTYLASSDSYAQIAARMNVSPRTADGYREALFAKLGTNTRVGAVLAAVRAGLVLP